MKRNDEDNEVHHGSSDRSVPGFDVDVWPKHSHRMWPCRPASCWCMENLPHDTRRKPWPLHPMLATASRVEDSRVECIGWYE